MGVGLPDDSEIWHSSPEILEPFRAGAGLQTPGCSRVQAGAGQLGLTRRYRLRLRRLPKLRVAGSSPVSRSKILLKSIY